MNEVLDGPADTSVMRIVHNALRRDLDRACAVLATQPLPFDAQRVAIGRHLVWLMEFLRRHHESEDDHLYPMVRVARPDAADLLDRMARDHDTIHAAMAAVTRCSERYAESSAARESLAAAIDDLRSVLLPHLEREEREMMPVVSASITERQWRDWDQTYNVKPLRPAELAFTGNWIMDGQTPADTAVIAALVPALPRWFIRTVLIRRYRRLAFTVWRLPEHSPYKAAQSGTSTVRTNAPIENVWRIVADVTRVGEWSHECRGAVWLGGASGPAIGARFRGASKSGFSRWSRECTVTACDPPTTFTYRTRGRFLGDASEWTFTFTPDGTGTSVAQHFRVIALPVWTDRLLWRLTPAHHDRRDALLGDLRRLAALAESDATPDPTRPRARPAGAAAESA